jgi:DEAD/DEAH box helicase domain-containing protein
LWKHPKGLLGRGLSAPPAVPLNASIVSGHLLCASEEFPLVGNYSVTNILSSDPQHKDDQAISDYDLFGCEETYKEAFENLLDKGHIRLEKINQGADIDTYSKHPSIERPSSNVSLRSIEPISYSIVNLDHPQQRGTDTICEEAILDNIPYSR